MTELDCSAGAKMMIERMQTNPEDFESGGRLYRVYENHRMSARDRAAVLDAYDKYLIEPQLMAAVLVSLTAPEVEEEFVKYKAQNRYALGSGPSGPNDPRLIYNPLTDSYRNNVTQQISNEMIEQQRRHLAAHKENMRYLQEKAAAEKKLSWPEKFRSMF